MPRRFPHLRGDSRLYPFAARTALRRRQKHRAWALRLCGAAVLCLAAGLILRDTVFRGGQPEAPVTTAESTEQPSPTPIAITPRAATVDVLATAESADSDVHSSPAPHPSPDATQAADILPQYQELYAQNPDLAGWLCINGTNINYPVVQADNSYYLRRGFEIILLADFERQLDRDRSSRAGPGLTDCIPPPERCFWMSAAALPRQTPLERPMP